MVLLVRMLANVVSVYEYLCSISVPSVDSSIGLYIWLQTWTSCNHHLAPLILRKGIQDWHDQELLGLEESLRPSLRQSLRHNPTWSFGTPGPFDEWFKLIFAKFDPWKRCEGPLRCESNFGTVVSAGPLSFDRIPTSSGWRTRVIIVSSSNCHKLPYFVDGKRVNIWTNGVTPPQQQIVTVGVVVIFEEICNSWSWNQAGGSQLDPWGCQVISIGGLPRMMYEDH